MESPSSSGPGHMVPGFRTWRNSCQNSLLCLWEGQSSGLCRHGQAAILYSHVTAGSVASGEKLGIISAPSVSTDSASCAGARLSHSSKTQLGDVVLKSSTGVGSICREQSAGGESKPSHIWHELKGAKLKGAEDSHGEWAKVAMPVPGAAMRIKSSIQSSGVAPHRPLAFGDLSIVFFCCVLQHSQSCLCLGKPHGRKLSGEPDILSLSQWPWRTKSRCGEHF